MSGAGALGGRRALPVALAAFLLLNALPALGLYRYGYDQVEYLDVARNLAEGEGFVSTLRTYLVGPEGFPQPPQLTRPILFPLLGGLAYAAVPDPRALQVLNLLLGLAAVALAYGVAQPLGPRVAGLTALALALSPAFGRDVTAPLSEASAIVAVLGALLLADRAAGAPGRVFATGLWIGLAYLARPATLAPGVAIAAYAVLGGAGPARRRVAALLAVAAGVGLATVPLWLLNARHGLPPLWAPARFSYDALHYERFLWDGLEAVPRGASAVLASHAPEVVGRVGRNAVAAVRLLLLEPQRLGLLLLLAPAAVWAAARAPWRARRLAAALGLLGAVNAAVYAASWSDRLNDRYLSLSFVLLLPLPFLGLVAAAESLPRAGRRALLAGGLLVLAAFAAGSVESNLRTLAAIRAGRTRAFWDPSSAEGSPATHAAAWLDGRLPPEGTVAASNPWIFAFLLERPVAILPRVEDAAMLEGYARANGVAAFVNLEGDAHALEPAVLVRASRGLGGSGRPVRFGRNAVYLLAPPRADEPPARSSSGAARKNSS